MAQLPLIAALLSAATTSTSHEEVRRHLIVVGVNHSLDSEVAPLRYADDDAARYAELLGPGASSVNLLAVLDPTSQSRFGELAARALAPTRHNLNSSARRVFSSINAELAAGLQAELMIIYIGHGAVDSMGQGYVTLLDGKLTRADLFSTLIAPSPALFNHVIVDACSAYHLLNRGPADAAAVRALLDAQTLAAHPNTGALLATSSDRATHEWSRVGGGVFSHQILSALSGAADVDGDARLRYHEVGAFVEAANAAVRDRRARIDLYLRPPLVHLERPLWTLGREPGPKLVLAQTETGHLAVADGRGLRVLELNKNGEQGLRVALAGEPPYEVSLGDATLQLDAAQGVHALGALPPAAESLEPRSSLSVALERDLYQVPFGRSYVAGYRARLHRELEAASETTSAVASSPSSDPGATPPETTFSESTLPYAAVGMLGFGGLSAVGSLVGLAMYGNATLALYNGKNKITALEAEQHTIYGNAGCALFAGAGCLSALSLLGGLGMWIADAPQDE